MPKNADRKSLARRIAMEQGIKYTAALRTLQANAPAHPWNLIPLGKGSDGMVSINVRKSAHTLITGYAGCGKTVLLHEMIDHVLTSGHEWEVILLDARGDLKTLRGRPGVRSVATTSAEAVHALLGVEAEMLARYERMREEEVTSFTDLKHDRRPILVAVDELRGFVSESVDPREQRAGHDLSEALLRVARIGRAAGVHLVVVTQRPDATFMSMSLRSLLSNLIACGPMNPQSSMLTLGTLSAVNTPSRPGSAILSVHGHETPFLARGAQTDTAARDRVVAYVDTERRDGKTLSHDVKALLGYRILAGRDGVVAYVDQAVRFANRGRDQVIVVDLVDLNPSYPSGVTVIRDQDYAAAALETIAENAERRPRNPELTVMWIGDIPATTRVTAAALRRLGPKCGVTLMHVASRADIGTSLDTVGSSCPDSGTCTHSCASSCFRVQYAGPLSIAKFPGHTWPADVVAAHQHEASTLDTDTTSDRFDPIGSLVDPPKRVSFIATALSIVLGRDVSTSEVRTTVDELGDSATFGELARHLGGSDLSFPESFAKLIGPGQPEDGMPVLGSQTTSSTTRTPQDVVRSPGRDRTVPFSTHLDVSKRIADNQCPHVLLVGPATPERMRQRLQEVVDSQTGADVTRLSADSTTDRVLDVLRRAHEAGPSSNTRVVVIEGIDRHLGSRPQELCKLLLSGRSRNLGVIATAGSVDPVEYDVWRDAAIERVGDGALLLILDEVYAPKQDSPSFLKGFRQSAMDSRPEQD